jgi:hypothetical protein
MVSPGLAEALTLFNSSALLTKIVWAERKVEIKSVYSIESNRSIYFIIY